MTQLLILLSMPEKVSMQYYRHVCSRFPQVTVHLVDHHSKVGPYIGTADVLVTFGPMMHDDVLKAASRLRWIQALGTGVDGIVDQPSLRPDVLVTRMHGFHGAPVSEAALLAMLALARDLPRSLRSQAERRWDRFPSRTLKDRTVGILGVGVIAAALAPTCRAMGMTVVGITSAPRDLPGFDRMCRREELEQVARELDFLVLFTPYSAATRGIVGRRVLAAMRPTSYLVNLARGGVVDEPALVEALREDRIAGAALDVFGEEPLPPRSRLWDLPNVILTPHLGGFFDGYPDHALPVLEENLRRFLAGDTRQLINLVSRS